MTTPVTVSLHAAPAAGYDQPFEMLGACHERVQRMLALLRRLRVHVEAHGADPQARQAARDVMRYFDVAAPAHHEDEERHVFPVLLGAGVCVAEIGRLRDEHREMAATWPAVRAILVALAEGRSSRFGLRDLAQLDDFERLYDWHLAAENELVFPAARQRTDTETQRAMGREMAGRRGVPVPRP